jgi:hypothetical protein
VEPRAGLDDVERRKFLTLTIFELRPLGCPARSQSLYRLRKGSIGGEKKSNEEKKVDEKDEVKEERKE